MVNIEKMNLNTYSMVRLLEGGIVMGNTVVIGNYRRKLAEKLCMHGMGCVDFQGYDPEEWNAGGRKIVTTTRMFACDGVVHDMEKELSGGGSIKVKVLDNFDDAAFPVIMVITHYSDEADYIDLFGIDGRHLNKRRQSMGELMKGHLRDEVRKVRNKAIGPYDRIRWKDACSKDVRISINDCNAYVYGSGKLYFDARLVMSFKTGYERHFIGPFQCMARFAMDINDGSIEIIDGMKEDEEGKYLEWVFKDICNKAN